MLRTFFPFHFQSIGLDQAHTRFLCLCRVFSVYCEHLECVLSAVARSFHKHSDFIGCVMWICIEMSLISFHLMLTARMFNVANHRIHMHTPWIFCWLPEACHFDALVFAILLNKGQIMGTAAFISSDAFKSPESIRYGVITCPLATYAYISLRSNNRTIAPHIHTHPHLPNKWAKVTFCNLMNCKTNVKWCCLIQCYSLEIRPL